MTYVSLLRTECLYESQNFKCGGSDKILVFGHYLDGDATQLAQDK